MSEDPRYVLTLSCPDRPGIVHAVSGVLLHQGCNIVESGQFTDPRNGAFFMRVSFSSQKRVNLAGFTAGVKTVAEAFDITWDLMLPKLKSRVLIMVSRFGHCLNDILFRYQSGTLPIEIPAIVSNHRDLEQLATHYDVPFHYLPVRAENKQQQEASLLKIIKEQKVELVVLARYMQILSNELCRALDGRAINIHHSFLPSFKGAKPYHQAYERGVKLIGATAHYVTSDLDEGPIIEQDVARAEHSLGPDDLVAAGRDIESVVLARALHLHIERRVMLSGQRTIIFR